MTKAVAIKIFFSRDSRPVENREIMDLKKGTTIEEYNALAADCAKALGEVITES